MKNEEKRGLSFAIRLINGRDNKGKRDSFYSLLTIALPGLSFSLPSLFMSLVESFIHSFHSSRGREKEMMSNDPTKRNELLPLCRQEFLSYLITLASSFSPFIFLYATPILTSLI